MLRSLLLLLLAVLFVGCKASSKSASVQDASGDARFSWEKDVAPAVDPTLVTVQAVRADLALLQLSPIEQRNAGTRLQLTKAGKNFVVNIIKSDDDAMVVAIAPGAVAPELSAGDSLTFAVLAE